MDHALLLLDNHVKNSHKYDQLPVLSCPLGNDCTKGHANGVFFTTTGLPFPEAQQLLRNHIELSHPEVPAKMGERLDQASKTVKKKRRATEHPEHTSISTNLLEIFDMEGNNGYKYYKRGSEYKCHECPMSGFINDQRFHRHVEKYHHREINLGTNNKRKKPHILRMIPECEKLGKFQCGVCGQRYRKNQDFANHKKRAKCKAKVNEDPDTSASVHTTETSLEAVSHILTPVPLEELSDTHHQSYPQQLEEVLTGVGLSVRGAKSQSYAMSTSLPSGAIDLSLPSPSKSKHQREDIVKRKRQRKKHRKARKTKETARTSKTEQLEEVLTGVGLSVRGAQSQSYAMSTSLHSGAIDLSSPSPSKSKNQREDIVKRKKQRRKHREAKWVYKNGALILKSDMR